MRRKLGEQGLVPGYARLLAAVCIGGSGGRLQCFVLRFDLVNVDQVAAQPSQPSHQCHVPSCARWAVSCSPGVRMPRIQG